MSKKNIIKGTIILSFAGITCRFLGFFYKIWLSRILAPPVLGQYQLIFPVYGICHTIFASSIITGISNLSAGASKSNHPFHPLKVGLFFSLTLSIILGLIIFLLAGPISTKLLMDPNLEYCLKLLSISFPFSAIYSCINGYYYGIQKTTLPALSQLLEQIVRISFILILPLFISNDFVFTAKTAVFALILGEITECIFSVLYLILSVIRKDRPNMPIINSIYIKTLHKNTGSPMIKYCYPLALSRLIISLLLATEAVLIPVLLRKWGLDYNASLTIYGILTGMALPFILFPNALTSSYNLMMLSEIAKTKATGNKSKLNKSLNISFNFSVILGIISSCIFLIFGRELGYIVFNNKSAGILISTLSIICIFMYISSVMSSVLNGLGQTKTTFFNSITAMIIRIIFTCILIPNMGMGGYIISLFFSDMCLCLLNIKAIKKHLVLNIGVQTSIIKPAINSITITTCFYYIYICFIKDFFSNTLPLIKILTLLGVCGTCILTILFTLIPLCKHNINESS